MVASPRRALHEAKSIAPFFSRYLFLHKALSAHDRARDRMAYGASDHKTDTAPFRPYSDSSFSFPLTRSAIACLIFISSRSIMLWFASMSNPVSNDTAHGNGC